MNICVLDAYTLNPGDLNWDILNNYGKLSIYNQTLPTEIVERAIDADVLIVNKVVLSAEIIAQLSKLKYVIVSATGYNNIDIDAFRKHNIPVSNIVNYGTEAVAQHTFALILALCNKVEEHNIAVKEGQWEKTTNFCFWNAPLIELKNKKLGIIGMGSIGNKVSEIGKAFGMDIIYYSKSGKKSVFGTETSLEFLLQNADVITLHTHLSTDNEGFVNLDFLRKLKKSAFLINTSRGKLVNEADLHFALVNNIISGAALDTLAEEPVRLKNPLIGAKNCIITPHIAWAPVETRNRMMEMIEYNIHSFLEGTIQSRIV